MSTRVRIIADYQLLSDDEGRRWMVTTLEHAVKEGLITAYEVFGAWYGASELQHVAFCVDAVVTDGGRIQPSDTIEEAKQKATALLNEIVHDTDVQVRWLSPRVA